MKVATRSWIKVLKSLLSGRLDSPSQSGACSGYETNGGDRCSIVKSNGEKALRASTHLSTNNGEEGSTCPADRGLLSL